MTTIRCPHCGQTYELTPEQVPQYAGRTIPCSACGQSFTVEIPDMFDVAPVAPPPPPQPPPAYAQRQAAYQQHPPQQPQRTNGLAVGSLVAGLLGFIIPVIGGIVAIVLGILGLNKAKEPGVGGKGLAIAGIIVGALSMVVTPCCISILLPSLNRARETANRVKCASNMKQIGQALMIYSVNNKGYYPPDLATLLATTPLMKDTLNCPSTADTPAPSPATLNAGGHLSYVYVPGHSARSSANAVVLYEPLSNHTNDGVNVLHKDGSVEFLPRAVAEPIITAIETGQGGAPPGAPVEPPGSRGRVR